MNSTILNIGCLWLLIVAIAQQDRPSASVTIMSGSESQRVTEGGSDGASVRLTAGEANLVLRFNDSRVGYGSLFWLWDPNSGLFLWEFHYDGDKPYRNANRLEVLLGEASVQISDGTLNYFSLSLTDLWIQKSDEMFHTAEDGKVHALQVIEANLPKIPDESFQHTARRLPLRDAIPVDFFYEPLSVAGVTASRIDSIKRQGDGWRIELEGEGSRRAVVLLDPNLELVEAKEVKP